MHFLSSITLMYSQNNLSTDLQTISQTLRFDFAFIEPKCLFELSGAFGFLANGYASSFPHPHNQEKIDPIVTPESLGSPSNKVSEYISSGELEDESCSPN